MLPFFSLSFLIFSIFLTRNSKLRSAIYIFSTWSIIILLDYYFSQEKFVNFSSKFDYIFLFFLITFFCFCFFSIFTFSKSFYLLRIKKVNLFTFQFFYLFSIFIACISILLFIRGLFLYSFSGLRNLIWQKKISFHVGISFPFVASCLFYMNKNDIKKRKSIIIFLLLLLAVISTSKQFFILSILYIVPWYKKNYKLKISTIIIILTLGVFCFFLLHFFTNRIIGSSKSSIFNILATLNGYLIGGLAVFQVYLDGILQQCITTGAWVKTGSWIGNVYSAFYFFYPDFNILILLLNAAFLGYLYALLKRKTLFWQYMYVYSIYPLLFMYFSDLYFPALKQWFVFIIAGSCLSFIDERRRKNENLRTDYIIQT